MPVLDSYARLSRNPSGRLEKVETQHADNGEVITRLGGVLVLSDAKHAAAIKAARARISTRLAQVDAEIAECEERQEAIAAK
ncbi:MAG: hypothetical protein ACRDTE_06010, partial [Pseudonocardiaceae bacterium]